MGESRRLSACVAAPHHLAAKAGAKVLADHGNAVDAAIAANLVLAVVTPYRCGIGGDLMALIAHGDGVDGYVGSGRAAKAASIDVVQDGLVARGAEGGEGGDPEMPRFGPHTVTVPGAVQGWFDLLERYGTKTFGALAADALRLARDGFELSAEGAGMIRRSAARQGAAWQQIYADGAEGEVLRQPALTRTLETLAAEGREPFYRGPIGASIVAAVQSEGGRLTLEDMSDHRGAWVVPLSALYRDVEVLELPPPSQGVGILEALSIVEAHGALPTGEPDRCHLLVEAVKTAQVDLGEYVTDPAAMHIDPADLLRDPWIQPRRRQLRMDRASKPSRRRPSQGGTAYLAAADSGGMMVSLIQSNYVDFGSGITAGAWGINLHNRGSDFSLDPDAANALAPGKWTRHTLSPGLLRRDARAWACFGTRGGDFQVPIGVQLVSALVDDRLTPAAALRAPRWVVGPPTWTVGTEPGFDRRVIEGLQSRGHEVVKVAVEAVGHAQIILTSQSDGPDGAAYVAAADPRTESAVEGSPA